MPGLIRRSDIDEVRSRTNIADIVGDFVTLRNAGVGSMKGLCPFHEERTPSFHVRPQVGFYHCFGCGESGDVFTFLQRMDHVTFQEAVERLAGRLGYELHYEDGGQASDHGQRARLLAANAAAETFFREQLRTPAAQIGRDFLGSRGFDAAAAEHFGVGFAPHSFDALRDALGKQGFKQEELVAAGLLSTNDRGNAYDRFRGRLIWPIRDLTGQTVGFGARKLLGDDQDKGPKYLNTPETSIYHKSQVLYGLDLARRDIAKGHRVVVVEGYTDVMACHLAGVTTAVATCGTSFGVDHIKILRRILGDTDNADVAGRSGEVVFTFDPDAAWQKAATRAFAEEQRFAAQTYVAIGPEGLDPCDLRLEQGDESVQALVESRVPMYEFMIRQRIEEFDRETVEGRVSALRAGAPAVASIRDITLREVYTRRLAGLLGLEISDATRAVKEATGRSDSRSRDERDGGRAAARDGRGPGGPTSRPGGPGGPGASGRPSAPNGGPAAPRTGDPIQDGIAQADAAGGMGVPGGDPMGSPRRAQITDLPTDPVTRSERDALIAILQQPDAVGPELASRAMRIRFHNTSLAVVRDLVAANLDRMSSLGWVSSLAEQAPTGFGDLVVQLSIAPILERPDRVERYCRSVVSDLVVRDILREKAELLGASQRADAEGDAERTSELRRRIADLETERRRLLESAP